MGVSDGISVPIPPPGANANGASIPARPGTSLRTFRLIAMDSPIKMR